MGVKAGVLTVGADRDVAVRLLVQHGVQHGVHSRRGTTATRAL